MIEYFLVLFVVVIVVTICLHHHSMKTKLYESSDCDARLALKANRESMAASNTTNDLMALTSITRSIQILECMLERHTSSTASDLAGVNIAQMLKTFTEQRNKIMKRFLEKYPDLEPETDVGTIIPHMIVPKVHKEEEEEGEEEELSDSSSSESD